MRFAHVAFAAMILAGPVAVSATTTPQLTPSLSVRVHGDVQSTCGLSNGAAGAAEARFENAQDTQTNLARADKLTLAYSVTCNTPMRVGMTSDNGGLETAARTSDADFTSLLAYTAALRLPDGSTALTCTSAAMDAAAGGCAGAVDRPVTAGAGQVEVVLNPDGRLLLQGEYRDRVTITVSPLIGGLASS